jgi:hypothetical protein
LGGELYVNAGGIFPTRTDTFSDNKIKAQGIYGLKGGIFLGDSAELEGSFGYLNHFEPSRSPNPLDMNTAGTFGQPSILGFLYDINFAWNFGNRGVFGGHINPYLVFGGGGLTAEVRHGTSMMETRSSQLTMAAESRLRICGDRWAFALISAEERFRTSTTRARHGPKSQAGFSSALENGKQLLLRFCLSDSRGL